MNYCMPIFPTLATQSIQAGPSRLCSLRDGRALGLYASASNVPKTPASRERNNGCLRSLVIEIIGLSAKDWELTS